MAIRWLRGAVLFVETILFTVIVPGTVTVWIPYQILSGSAPGISTSWTARQYLAVVAGTFGAVIYFRCLWDFAVTGRGIPAPVDHPKRLVVRGLYRYVRNPMYLGVLFILLAESAFFGSSTLLMYTAGWFLFVHLVVVLYEEPTLRHKFGASYERYTRAVRRWRPGGKYRETA